MTSRVSVAAVALLGCSLLASGCGDRGRRLKDDYVSQMRHFPLGRLVFGFNGQISSRSWTRPRSRQHTLQQAVRRDARVNRQLHALGAVHPPHDVAVLHKELVAAAARVNDALLDEAELLRPNQPTSAQTYDAYISEFETIQRHQEVASQAGSGAYYAIRRKGYDIGPSGIEDFAPYR